MKLGKQYKYKIRSSTKRLRKLIKEPNKIWNWKNIVTEQNSVDSFSIRLDQAQEWINELEDKSFETILSEEQKERRLKRKKGERNNLQEKRNNLCITGVIEERRAERVKNLFKEIMTETIPNPGRDLDIQVQEAIKSHQNFQSKTIFSKTHCNKTV